MISFVIPAHNEASEISACLETIHRAAEAIEWPYEVIVVDDASNDETAAIAAAYEARVIRVDHRQIAATRNAGAAEAAGDILVFVDADTQINAVLIHEMLDALDAGATAGGARIRIDDAPGFPERVLLIVVMAIWRMTGWAAGCFIYSRRSAFEAVGGFDERYYASEEIHLSRALKRQGPFKVLKTPVVTSGRKWRLYSRKEQWRTIGHFILGGFAAGRRREGLDLWYDGRRERSKKKTETNANIE